MTNQFLNHVHCIDFLLNGIRICLDHQGFSAFTCFIIESPAIITESSFTLAPLCVRSTQGFSPLFLTFLIAFVCSSFSMDLSRLVWFWLSHVLVLRLTCLSIGFMTCFDFSLIRTELCSWATSNNFCLFEQLSLSSLFFASRIPILLWNSLSWELTKLIGWGEQKGSLSVFIILAGVGV